MTSSSSEAEQDQEPDEPSTLPSAPSFRFDQNNMSSQSLLSRNGSGYESQYGSLFGSRFSLTDGSGIFISSLALTIIISAIAIVGIILVAVIITLAVMLSSCEQNSTVTLENQGFSDVCYSFRLNVELNNVRGWTVPSACESDVFNYIHGGQYTKDVEVSVDSARRYLKTLAVDRDESYAIVLDIDETALSNSLYYENHSYGSKGFVDHMWGMWMNKTKALPMVPVLELYRELRVANWSIFFISERPESALDLTVQNLIESGYEGWTSLLLRSADDSGLTVQAFKSNKRIELENQGYQIRSVLGDQWSDIVGPATGTRTFKLPNPMYQIL